MKIQNLTPHDCHLHLSSGEVRTLPKSGSEARCKETSQPFPIEGCDLPLVTSFYGEVTGLPEPEAGTLYLVSGLVRAALPHRKDLVSPGEQVRDAAGRVVGCKALVRSP